MGVRDESDEAINSGKTGMYFCAWWKMGYGITDAYRNDPTANWQAYTVYTDDGQWNTREQCPVASYVICNKNISEDVAKAAIIMNNVWIRDENKLTTDYGQNTSIYWYPLRNSMGMLDECEVTYDTLYKVLNGEATAEDYNDPDSAMKLLYNDCVSLETGIKDYEVGSNMLSIETSTLKTRTSRACIPSWRATAPAPSTRPTRACTACATARRKPWSPSGPTWKPLKTRWACASLPARTISAPLTNRRKMVCGRRYGNHRRGPGYGRRRLIREQPAGPLDEWTPGVSVRRDRRTEAFLFQERFMQKDGNHEKTKKF